MAALTQDRNTAEREGSEFHHPVAAGVIIYAGALVVLDASGNAAPATTATGLTPAGRAEELAGNAGGAAGDVFINTRKGVFQFANDGTIDRANIGDGAYFVDDQTLADNDGTGTRSAAGVIVDVDSDGVWLKIS